MATERRARRQGRPERTPQRSWKGKTTDRHDLRVREKHVHQRGDPVPVDDGVSISHGENVSATLGDGATGCHSNTGRAAVPDLGVPFADQCFDVLAIVRRIDQHEIERGVRETQQRIETRLKPIRERPVAHRNGHEWPGRERGRWRLQQRCRVDRAQRAATLDGAFRERQRTGPGMLMQELTNQGGAVETAVRHSAGSPAKRPSVQPEVDKSGWAVRNGQIAQFSRYLKIDD